MNQTMWLQHPLYEFYRVSNDGRVRTVDRTVEIVSSRTRSPYTRFFPGCEIKSFVNPHNGYRSINLNLQGRKVNASVHRMVCEAFHGLPAAPNLEVRHRNGNKLDCRAENLTWGTRTENIMDRQVHGADYQLNKTHCPAGHEYTEENTYHQPGRRNSRSCRACTRKRNREAARRKAAQNRAA